MTNTFFIIISSFLPLALLNLFAERNSSSAQPQRGQVQPEDPLLGFSLPAGPITENDIPGIRTVIEQVLNKISEPVKTAGKRPDYQTIKSCILSFQGWLKAQGCVSQASATYDIETTDRYPDNIFITYPGQLPFDISFKMEGDIKKPFRLLIFVTTVDLFNLASLAENRSLGGVPVPKNWPKDTWSYWEDRL